MKLICTTFKLKKSQHCTQGNDKIKISQIQMAQQLTNATSQFDHWSDQRIAKLSVSQQRLSISKITLALCCPAPPVLFSTAGQGTIGWFVDTELNRWHPQCRQTGRQAKGFPSACILTGEHTHTHTHTHTYNRTGTHSSKWLHGE